MDIAAAGRILHLALQGYQEQSVMVVHVCVTSMLLLHVTQQTMRDEHLTAKVTLTAPL